MKTRLLNMTVEIPLTGADDEVTDPEVVAASLVLGFNNWLLRQEDIDPTLRAASAVDPKPRQAEWVSEPEEETLTPLERIKRNKRSGHDLLQDMLEREVRK